MSLKDLQQFCDTANRTNSKLDKLEVISQYPSCQKYWKIVYDQMNYQFGVTAKNLKKNSDIIADNCPYDDILDLLKALHCRVHTGHDAIGVVNKFIADNEEYADLIYNMIDRNLKTRTDAKLINKIYPGCIPQFNVALAASYDEKTAKCVTFDGSWYVSRKLDGVRCVAIVDERGKCTLWSRGGKQFETLGKVEEAIEGLGLTDIVFDGELCIVDQNGDEDFQSVMKEIRKKDHQIDRPRFQAFDIITKEDFETQVGYVPYSDRYETLHNILNEPNPYIVPLKQILLNSSDDFERAQDEANEGNWEGLILRKNVPYEGKRSKDMLKYKEFHDAEYVVKDVEMGMIRWINPETGKDEQKEMLRRVTIEHKGEPVGVGSGFSIDERQRFHANPEEIIGKVITVQYFEESQDQDGSWSLRFPTVKVIHGDKREV